MVLPKPLPRNGVIGIVSPASAQRDPSRLERGVRYLETLGYRVELGRHALTQRAYLAGTDDERLQDLHEMFADRRIDAVFCARGGYGSARLLDRIDYTMIKRSRKVFVGFSDITALQLALLRRASFVTFSGALPSVDMADGFDRESEASFWRAITSTKALGVITQSAPLRAHKRGRTTGMLMGGNLSIVASLCGTKYMPPTSDAILVLEDIGEESYSIDRLLTQLRLSGVLTDARGVAFGRFTADESRTASTPARPVSDILAEFSTHVQGPVLSNLLYGHESKKLTLPFGVRASLVVGADCTLKLSEAACAE